MYIYIYILTYIFVILYIYSDIFRIEIFRSFSDSYDTDLPCLNFYQLNPFNPLIGKKDVMPVRPPPPLCYQDIHIFSWHE